MSDTNKDRIEELEEMPNMEGIDVEETDMSLDSDLLAESLAVSRMQNIIAYNRLKVQANANKAIGNDTKADEDKKNMAILRMTVAIIDRDCPRAKTVMKRIVNEEKERIKNLGG